MRQPHNIECDDTPVTTKERHLLPNGWYIEVKRNEICEADVWLFDPNDCVLMHGAMMQPDLFAQAMNAAAATERELTDKLEETLKRIDALIPDRSFLSGCSESAMRGWLCMIIDEVYAARNAVQQARKERL